MRSFLSIFSRKVEYSSVYSIIEAVGLDSEKRAKGSVIGSTHSSAFLHFDIFSKSIELHPCFIDSERYSIQYDIRVFSNGANDTSIKDLFNPTTMEGIYKDPEKINELPIRDFHLLIWDKSKGKLLVFRDQIGIWPLYYFVDDNWLIISTDIVLIRSLKAVNLSVSEEWIADSLVSLQSAPSKTFYRNIQLVEPGHVLFSDLKHFKTASYYKLIEALDPVRYELEEANEIFRSKLVDAIEKRMIGFYSAGSELSGGLDSSALVALAYPIAQNSGMNFHTFSNVLPESLKTTDKLRKDESFYSSMLIKRLGICNHYPLIGEGKGILSELRSHLKTMGMPTQQLFTMFSDEIYDKVSELNIPLLLSGYGGDEGISYSGSGFYEEMAYERNWEVLLKEMKTSYKIQNKNFYRGRVKYLIQRYIPLGTDLLYEIGNRNHWKRKKIRGFGYDHTFGQKMNIRYRYMKGKGYIKERRIVDRQYQRLRHPYVSMRLIGSYQVSVQHGFSYAFPFLDRDLLEFTLSLPPTYKYRNGTGRILLREALLGKVPEDIRLRNDKQRAVVPTIYYRLLKDENAIRHLIKHSQRSNTYHYVDYQKLAKWLELLVRNEHPKGFFHNPNAFYNSLQILLLQEMERTGEYKTGISY